MGGFLDANIFLYAVGGEHPLRDPCRNVLRRYREGEIEATTSTEVLQEILYVLTRRGQNEAALQLARSIIDAFPHLLPVTRSDMERACEVLKGYPGINARDAVHIATMRNNDITVIISTDRHFDGIDGITRLDPADQSRVRDDS